MTRYLFPVLILLTSCATPPSPNTGSRKAALAEPSPAIASSTTIEVAPVYPTALDVESHPVYKCRTPREVMTVALRVDMGVVVVDQTGERIESWGRTRDVEACEPVAAKVPTYGEMLYMYRSFVGLQKQCRDAVNAGRAKVGKSPLTTDERAVCEFEAVPKSGADKP